MADRVYPGIDPRIYPRAPVVGVGAVVINNGKTLLVRRGKAPLKGTWSLAGGMLREDETLHAGLKRELFEECGIEIEIFDLIDIFEYIERDESGKVVYHYLVFDFKAVYKRGSLRHASDAADAKWVEIEDLEKYDITDAVKHVIAVGLEL